MRGDLDIPAGYTAADFVTGNVGYSLDELFADLVKMDYDSQVAYLRNMGARCDRCYVAAVGGTSTNG